MQKLSKRDKYEVLTRNSRAMADMEKITKPFSLKRVFSPQALKIDKVLRSRLTAFFNNGLIPSPQVMKSSLERIRHEQRPDEVDHQAVRVIPHEKIQGNREKPGIIRWLRDGRLLTLQIDLSAAHKEDILKEIGQYIIALQPKQIRSQRKRKRHKATEHIDMWDVYDRVEGGEKIYQIAKQFYRERTGNRAGFGSHTKDHKAVERKVAAARSIIKNNPYPPQ